MTYLDFLADLLVVLQLLGLHRLRHGLDEAFGRVPDPLDLRLHQGGRQLQRGRRQRGILLATLRGKIALEAAVFLQKRQFGYLQFL